MDCRGIRFTRHAFERLFARVIPPDSVMRILSEGEVIVSYPDDVPFPSALVWAMKQESRSMWWWRETRIRGCVMS